MTRRPRAAPGPVLRCSGRRLRARPTRLSGGGCGLADRRRAAHRARARGRHRQAHRGSWSRSATTYTPPIPTRRCSRSCARNLPGVRTSVGGAEQIAAVDNSYDVVVGAQCFHWFDHDVALPEIRRVLKPRGRLSLVWNVRDERIPWVKKLGRIIGTQEQVYDPTEVLQASLAVHRGRGQGLQALAERRPPDDPGPGRLALQHRHPRPRGARGEDGASCSSSTTATDAAWTACRCHYEARCFRSRVVKSPIVDRRRAEAATVRPTPPPRVDARHAADRLPLAGRRRRARCSNDFRYGAPGPMAPVARAWPAYASRHRGRPRHVPDAPHRLARLPGAARGPDPGQRRAVDPPPAHPARHAGAGGHRHRGRAGVGRRRRPPRAAGRAAGERHPGARPHPQLRPQPAALRRDRLPGPHRRGHPAGGRRADRRHPAGVRAVPHRRAWPAPPTRWPSGSPASSSWPSSTPAGPG